MIARLCFPAACTVLLMLLTRMPFGFANQAQLLPAVTLACVWFWSLFRPGSLPPLAVFLIGVLLDLLGYLPLGVGLLALLLTHGVALRYRRTLAAHGFLLNWLAFLPVAAGFAALLWGLMCLLSFRLLDPGPAVFQFVVTVALYPAIAVLFARAHRTLADPALA
jgi:rod shape-determining protein MreD